MEKNRLYFIKKGDDLQKKAKKITREVVFSKDSRDLGMVAKSVPCQNACPVVTNIPGYIRCVYEKRYGRSYELNRMYNILPGVLGRICSRPCEEQCRHGESDLGEPIQICHLKRASADLKSPMHRIKENFYYQSDKKIAIIGSGPAGLAAAHELATLGYKVSILEKMEKPGGMLVYGIPEFRLPRDVIDIEINNILRIGIDLQCNVNVGKNITIEKLLKQHDAVIVATGSTLPNKLNIPGEDLKGVYNGLDFMRMVNEGETPYVGRKSIVIGAGFTAMDCARTAIRLGVSNVTVNIRKTEEYLSVDDREKFEVEYEKVKFNSLVTAKRILEKNGKVTGIEFLRTRLDSKKDSPGRTVIPIEGSEFILPADSVIVAIGQQPDMSVIWDKIKVNGKRVYTEKDSYKTSVKKLFAAGDCATKATDVITAISSGRKCAHEMDYFLSRKKRKEKVVRMERVESTDRERNFDFIPKIAIPSLELKERFKNKNVEVDQSYNDETAFEESKRCYLCNLKYEIDISRCIYCSACIDVAPRDCIKLIKDIRKNKDGSYDEYIETREWKNVVAIAIDNQRCIRCGKCHEVCPMECISVTKTELIELDMEA